MQHVLHIFFIDSHVTFISKSLYSMNAYSSFTCKLMVLSLQQYLRNLLAGVSWLVINIFIR